MSNFSFREEEWEQLIPLLRARVARWVCTSYRLSWKYQRHEIIEDIVDEAMVKIVAYAQQAELGAVRRIDSLEKIGVVTAYHCYVDAFRRYERVMPLLQNTQEPGDSIMNETGIDSSEGQAIDNVYYGLVFIQAARWIVKFPDKQRTALLIDLAHRMYFDPIESTPLQKAFALVGISICDYNRPLPSNAKERANHAAHLSLAYKRLALLAYMQRYTLAA